MEDHVLWRNHFGQLPELLEELDQLAGAVPARDRRLEEWVQTYRSDLEVLFRLSRFEALLDDPFFNYGNSHPSCRIVVTAIQKSARETFELLLQNMSASDADISREWGQEILTIGHSIILHERTVSRLIGRWFKDAFWPASN